VALGVLYCDPAPSYEQQITGEIAAARKANPQADLNALLRAGPTWVKENGPAS
jgi:hypothetical protein